MEIKTISKEEHALLKDIQSTYPALTFQNKGYEGLDHKIFTPAEKDAFKKVTDILKSHITGFSRFQNFRHNKAGEIEIRLQYNYNYDRDGVTFIGVGYILLDELLNGFNE